MGCDIKSGYTEDIYANTVHWYGEEEISGFIELEELTEGKSMEDMLRRLRPLDFSLYIIRYLAGRYDAALEDVYTKQRIEPHDREAFLKKAYEEADRNGGRKPILEKMSSLVYEDFQTHCAGAEEMLEKWSKSNIRKVISKKKISAEEFYQLAIGIDMPYEDVEKFLRDVLKKGGFDFWNIDEMLYYICIRYPVENEFKFFKEKKVYYEKVKPKRGQDKEEGMNTKWLGSEVDKLLQKIEGSFMEKPEDRVFDEFLCEYKYWITNTSNEDTRTAVRVFRELLKEFMKISKTDMEDAMERKKKKHEYPKGSVIVYYDGSKQFVIPKGTIFLKEGKEGAKEYQSAEEVTALPQESMLKQLKVACAERTELHAREEENIGYVPKKTNFQSEVPGILSAVNKSMFKAGKKKDADGKTRISGNLDITAKPGTVIEKGTMFRAGNTVFTATETLEFQAEVMVPVIAKTMLEEAGKNKITKILMSFDGKEYILGMSNHKIGIREKTGEEKGKFCGYVYTPKSAYGAYGKEEADRLGKLLEPVLEGTELTPVRISIIENTGNVIITRNELLTMAALHSMAISQFVNDNSGMMSEQEAKERALLQLAETMQRINEILGQCGFQPLYLANPYDCLIVYVSIAYEPLSVFRDLWGTYLNYKESL